MYHYISGIMTMGFWVAGIFFFRFWKKTRDRLMILFALSFWMMAVERVVLGLSSLPIGDEARAPIYSIRLLAFLLIIFGIVDKNRKHSG